MMSESQGWKYVSEQFSLATKKPIYGCDEIISPDFTTPNNFIGMCAEWHALWLRGLISTKVNESANFKIRVDMDIAGKHLFLFSTYTNEGRLQRVAYALKKSEETL